LCCCVFLTRDLSLTRGRVATRQKLIRGVILGEMVQLNHPFCSPLA